MHQQDNGRRGIEFSNPPPPHMIPVIDSAERVAIFIDGSNLYHALKSNLTNIQIDSEKFCFYLLSIKIRIDYIDFRRLTDISFDHCTLH